MIRTTRSLRGRYTQRFLYLFILMIFLLVAAVFIMDIAAKPSHTSIATTKTTPRSNSFLMYENNSTLGIKIQYPTNWEKDSYKDKVIFFAPSLAERHGTIIPVGLFVKISNLPFQI